MRFENQVVVITGSGRGIGRGAALEFAKEGAKVVINDVDKAAADAVVSEIRENGGVAVNYIGNVGERKCAQELIETAENQFGTVNVLVNNAAVIRPAMIHKMTEEDWDTVVDIGMKGIFNCLQAVSPIFIKRGKENPEAKSNGKIINMTSIAGLTGTIGQINYSAMKAGVVGMTMSTAREWGKYRIQSNATAFGVVETRMTETIRGDKLADIYKKKNVLGRFALIDDVIPGILFLGSSGSDYITGHVLNISGGSHIGV